MSVAIKRITAKDIGPLRSVDYTLGRFNVIFGGNEKGKTSLVEFLLRSLFRSARKWNLRDMAGAGQVYVAGLEDELVHFSPDSDRKLEDYWADQAYTFPPDLAKLLVVKGAELELASGVAGGIDRTIIRQFLSQTALLDSILGGIPATIQTAWIDKGQIEGPNRGKLKDQRSFEVNRDNLDNLFRDVSEDYSSGRLVGCLRQEQELRERIAEQIRAKRHLSYQLHEKRARLLDQLGAFPEDQLKQLEEKLGELSRIEDALKEMEDKAAQTQHAAEDHRWLKNALATLDEKPLTGGRPRTAVLVLTAILLAAGAAFSWLGNSMYAVGAVVAGMLLGGWYAFDWMRWDKARPDVEARNAVQQEFKQRFNLEQDDYASMRARLELLHADAVRHEDSLLAGADYHGKKRGLQAEIRASFHQLGQADIPAAGWKSHFETLRKQQDDLNRRQTDLEKRIIALQVPEADMLPEPAADEFDPALLTELQEQLHAAVEAVSMEKQAYEGMLGRIRQATGAPIDTSWEELLDRLQDERRDAALAYRSATAEILAQILVSEVVSGMLEEEDNVISARLASPGVEDPLYAVTHRYRAVTLKDDQLYVSDPYQSFALADLSTGAQEQVLLALRMAFAVQLMQKERMFLVLDDAFQYADWKRREHLVDRVVQLGEQGWQILYLTMDDHLRGLFESRGKKAFGTAFAEFDLTQN